GPPEQSAGTADRCALAALHAFRQPQVLLEGRADAHLSSSVCKVDGTDALHLLADPHARPAQDALSRIVGQAQGRQITLAVRAPLGKAYVVQTVAAGQILQGAIPALAARRAGAGGAGQSTRER